MNLLVSSISRNNNISFGMAKFSEKGRQFAKSCSDIYEPFSKENPSVPKLNPAFTKRVLPWETAPFRTYMHEMFFPMNGQESSATFTREAAEAIIAHGTTDDPKLNANFVKQLITCTSFIYLAAEQTQKQLSSAAHKVFDKNWDNPNLSKKQTLQLLELAKYSMNDKEYSVALSVIQKSDD